MEHYIDNFSDDLGPEKIIHIYEPKSKLKAIVVIDNISLGPSLGGCRMAPDIDDREVFRLARAMTLKNALCDLPHGGGKSGIIADPKTALKEPLMRQFAQSIKELVNYIPGPDMGTDESCMAYIFDEIGRAVGRPKVLGGIPLDHLGMTGFGLAVSADIASEELDIPLKNANVVIQGFGNVGKATAKLLAERGAKIIATCDINGAIYNPHGINVDALFEYANADKLVQLSGLGEKVSNQKLLEIESDIFVPAARPDVFTTSNQHLLKTKLVLEGANIPITHEAAKLMNDRGITIIPDIIANGGGVICASTEYKGMTETEAFERVKVTIGRNTEELLARIKDSGVYPHEMAVQMGKERIAQAMSFRAHM